jgi:hypothetical protein
LRNCATFSKAGETSHQPFTSISKTAEETTILAAMVVQITTDEFLDVGVISPAGETTLLSPKAAETIATFFKA